MNLKILLTIFALSIFMSSSVNAKKLSDIVKVSMKTNYGVIELELNHKKAPITVQNFIKYAESGFYNGTIFHRVINGFMIQGGGFTKDLVKKTTQEPIKNEATNGLGNELGTIAMARTPDIHSATSQFFINVNNNSSLNHTDTSPRGYGYAVFGKVSKGMPIINKIKMTKTKIVGRHRNVPTDPVIIEKVTINK